MTAPPPATEDEQQQGQEQRQDLSNPTARRRARSHVGEFVDRPGSGLDTGATAGTCGRRRLGFGVGIDPAQRPRLFVCLAFRLGEPSPGRTLRGILYDTAQLLADVEQMVAAARTEDATP